tara:strand:- start:707 stop:1183 length:477 start_codon:yes stop_codon:yes gene_type:complete
MSVIRHLSLKRYLLSGLRRYLYAVGMNVLPFSSMRVWLLRLTGVRIGNGCYIGFNVIPDTNYPELVCIEDNVTISHNCLLVTHTQSPVKTKLSEFYNLAASIVIRDGAWIGIGVTILPGVSILPNCFIGAGSVLTKSTDNSFSLYAGSPARFIKRISD